MAETKTCPDCGATLPGDAPQGFCPQCLLAAGATAATQTRDVQPNTVTVTAQRDVAPRASHITEDKAEIRNLKSELGTIRQFGDYDLLEEIARGGMGIVYKARQKSLDRLVAVKMILGGPSASKEFIHRFRTEAAAAANLRHPNIVAVHEVGAHEGENFLAMDFVDGPNLARLVGQQPLPASRAARYLKVVAEAVQFAHDRGILHRDLKPSNILVGSDDQPRVTDFGLAKRLDSEHGTHNSELTLSGQVLGSPNYMSPEQAQGKRGTVGKRSDLYSLGAILYHLLTGRPPFQGDSLTDVLHQVVNTDPVSPRLLNPSVPVDLETLCLKCLEKEPQKRYASAQEAADELGRFLNDEPIHARPVTRVEWAWRWCRRKPALAGSLATAALLLLIVAVGSPIAALRINRARLETQREARRAEAGETAFRLSAYSADMNVAQAALQEHNLSRALRSLERWTNAASTSAQAQTPADLRGWEWRYLWSQCKSDERATLTRPDTKHSGFIVSVAYSPDGKWLASGSHDGRVKLFDLSTRREVAELQHKKEVRAVAFSPRDSTLATLCADGFLRFWDPKTRTNLGAVPAGANGYEGAVAFSRDGAYLAFSSPASGSVTISNLTLRTSMVIHHGGGITGLAFSPDGTVLATRGWDSQIKLWDIETQRLKHVLSHAAHGTSTVTFSPDGRQLVSTSIDQTWKLWDTESRQLLHTEKTRFSNPVAAVFLLDGRTIAVANADYTISLWHPTAEGWKEQAVLQGHKHDVWALALSPDGTELASGSTDGEVKLWSTTPPSAPNDWMPWPSPLPIEDVAFCFSTDARMFLLALTNRTIELWDSATLTKTMTLTWPETNASRFALYSDGKFIASSGGKDGTIKLWRVTGRSLQEERNLKLGTPVEHLAFSPNGKTLAAASGERCMVWGVESGQRLLEFDQEGTFRLKFSPDSTLLASTRVDGKVNLWQVSSGHCVRTSGHEHSSTDAAFFPDGRRIVTGAFEWKAKMWDATSGSELAVFQGQLEGAHSVAVSPDGQRVAIGADEGVVKLFLLDGSQQPLDVLTLPCRQNWVWRVAFLPDGETIVAACREGLQVWHAPSLAEIAAKEKMEASK